MISGRYTTLPDAGDRLWDAAWALDEARGDVEASEWTARKVRELIPAGEANDPRKVTRLAEALERRLRREREGVPA